MKKILTCALMCCLSLFANTVWADDGFDLTFSPEDGAVLTELSSFSVCGNIAEMDLSSSGWDTTLYVEKDGEQVAIADFDGVEENDEGYNVITFNIVDMEEWEPLTLTEEGTYTISIPEGHLAAGEAYNNAATVTYTISGGNGGGANTSESFDLTFDPENGSKLSQLNSITICGNSDEMDFNVWDTYFYVVKDGENVAIANWYGSSEDENGNNVFYFETVDTEEWEGITLTEEGTYTMEIPAGFFHIGDALSNAVTLTYTIGGGDAVNPEDYSYTVSPEAGELTEVTSAVTISCTTGMYVVDGTLSSIKVYKDGESYTTVTGITPVNSNMYYDEGETLELGDALSEAGEYEVVIPAGFFYYFVDGRTNDIDMGEIKIQYTISEDLGGGEVDASEGFDLTFDPESGSTLSQLNSITICGNSDEMDFNVWDTYFYVVKDGENVAIANWYGSSEDENGNNVFYFETVDTEEWEGITLTEEGTYTMEIPAGFFHIGDALSNAVTLTYTIGGGDAVNPEDYSYTVSPEAGELTEVTSAVTISCTTGMYVVDGTLSSIKVYKDGESYTTVTGITPVNSNMYYDEGETLKLGTTLSEAGEYEVVIPAGFFYYFVDGRTNDIDMGKITINYTIKENLSDGISTINVNLNDGVTEIYNLAGQRIESMQNGKVNVVKFSDGTTKKIILK
ncbi:MAG: hypothetical protein LUC88_10790 [Prevotella sp.]|nr:hypothetical protein [Prevotella sp.]